MRKAVLLALVTLTAMLALDSSARGRRDPLTSTETDQLREVAQEPAKKLKLYVTFARARLSAIEQLRKDPKMAPERGQRIHDLLEDFTNIIDEMDANISDFEKVNADMRKPLAEIIQADSGFQLTLRTLKEAAASDATAAKEANDYTFVLTDAVEAVDSNLDGARELLDRQNVAFAQAKGKKK